MNDRYVQAMAARQRDLPTHHLGAGWPYVITSPSGDREPRSTAV